MHIGALKYALCSVLLSYIQNITKLPTINKHRHKPLSWSFSQMQRAFYILHTCLLWGFGLWISLVSSRFNSQTIQSFSLFFIWMLSVFTSWVQWSLFSLDSGPITAFARACPTAKCSSTSRDYPFESTNREKIFNSSWNHSFLNNIWARSLLMRLGHVNRRHEYRELLHTMNAILFYVSEMITKSINKHWNQNVVKRNHILLVHDDFQDNLSLV